MKNLKQPFKALILLMITFTLFTSCNDDEPYMQEPTAESNSIVDFVSKNSNYSILLEALQSADGDLDRALSTGSYTVFAPNNDAFRSFLTQNNYNSLSDVPTDVLSQVLLNHVLKGKITSSDLSIGYAETLSTWTPNENNLDLFIDLNNGVKINGQSNVTMADINVDNGVIHAVDAVISPATVETFIKADTKLSILETAMTRSESGILETLATANGTSPAPFTLFAPVDSAFQNLLSELNVSSLSEIDRTTLIATLKMHAISENNVLASKLSDGLVIRTLGGDIKANITGGATLTDSNNRVSNIKATDIQASNGVVHVIDKVILP